MKKFISVGFATIGSLILIFAIVFTSLEIVVNNETFINNEFTKLGISSSMGMSNNDLVRSTVRLIDYMQGEVDDINVEVTVNGEKTPMFVLDQEVEHMKDVRAIYLQIKGYRDTGMLVLLVLFLLSTVFNFRKAPQMLAQGFLSGGFIALLFFGFLGTWAVLDFTNFWTFFHQMLFWNDLWLFDATESRMINMLPEKLFSDIVGQIFLYAGLVIAALIAVSVACLVLSSDTHKRRQLEARKRKKARKAAMEARKAARAQAKAEAEKAKRIAKKKAKKAAQQKERAKKAQLAAKEKAKAGAKAANKRGVQARQARSADGEGADEILLGEGVSEELSEGYAADFFQSGTSSGANAGRTGMGESFTRTTTTTTTTTGGAYPPETLSAEFFKSYGAARGVTQPSGRTVSEQSFETDGAGDAGFTQGPDVYSENFREVYDDGGSARSVSGRSEGREGAPGKKPAARKPAASKQAAKKAPAKAKKRAHIQDDTGFFDD